MVQIAIAPDEFSSQRPKPKSTSNGYYVYLITLMAAIGGLLFGYDTGVVSAVMLYLPNNRGMAGLTTIWQEVIISITPGMAGLAALVAGKSSDYFGRRMTIIAASGIFAIGALTCGLAPEPWTLLAGRILLGIAIGFASTVIPVFISEGAPTMIRGQLITIYQFMIAFGFAIANAFAAWFAHYDPENVGWRLMFGLAVVPAIIQLVGFLFLPETPRYLMHHGREAEAQKVLNKLYGDDSEWIAFEIEALANEVQHSTINQQQNGTLSILWRVLRTAHVRKALLLGCALQMFQQFAAINTILYYTGTIIRSAGVRDKITTIWISCGVSAVQAIGTIPPLKLIDKLGRRTLLLTSLVGVVITLSMMGGAFIVINNDSRKIDTALAYNGIDVSKISNKQLVDKCAKFSNCDSCVTTENCGFCSSSKLSDYSQCLPINPLNSQESLIGFCNQSANETSDYLFADNYCETKYTALPIVIMVLYLSIYAFGMGPIPWVFNAEVYPIWARSTCVSLSTFTNWTFNLVISLTFLSLSQAITKYGSFFLYAAISFVGVLIFYKFLPETRGQRIEEIELLFMDEKSKRQATIAARRTDERVIDGY